MIVSDPLVMPPALTLLECFEQELEKVESPPARVEIRPGVTVVAYVSQHDDECCAGLAWVRPAGLYPSSAAFPAVDEQLTGKGVEGWAVRLELGVLRCAPRPPANAVPSAADWLTVTQAVMDDAAAMRRAICCYIETAYRTPQIGRQNVIPGDWQPIEVEGGCVGGLMSVLIKRPECDCVDAGPES